MARLVKRLKIRPLFSPGHNSGRRDPGLNYRLNKPSYYLILQYRYYPILQAGGTPSLKNT